MRLLLLVGFVCLGFAGVVHAEPITKTDLRKHIEILASDEFEGREPGTEGENKTVNYIATQWAKAGLMPAATNSSWYEPIDLIERNPVESKVAFSITGEKRKKKVSISKKDIVLRSRTTSETMQDIPVVYAGYANEEPSELSRLVRGKLALLPFRKPVDREDLPDYADRKKQLLKAGAAAVISIVDGENRWRRIKRYFERGNTTLDGIKHHAEIEGIVKRNTIRKLLKKAGLSKLQLTLWQAEMDFRPTDLPLKADLFSQAELREYVSHNVIGKISGTNPQRGAVVFLGHWDHFGICRREDPTNPKKDRICNGAVDNASGISLLIETAKHLADSKPDRDIFFLATTAEEKGLLGAYAFIDKPPIALSSFVAAFNADTIALNENGKKIAVVGLGQSDLDGDIEKIAKMNDREIDRSGTSDAYLKRQDGYAFLEKGIPAYMVTSAFADEELINAFVNGPYHDVGDELTAELPLGGATADANFHIALGRYFGSTETYPQKATSE